MVRLNGWQRMWVVMTVVWGGLVGTYTWIEWPQESERRIRTYTIKDNNTAAVFDIRYGDTPPADEVTESVQSKDKRFDRLLGPYRPT